MGVKLEVRENPFFERARVLSKMKADGTIDVEWAINFIYEWEKITKKLKRKKV